MQAGFESYWAENALTEGIGSPGESVQPGQRYHVTLLTKTNKQKKPPKKHPRICWDL